MADERHSKNIISAEDLASVARWQPPPMDQAAINALEMDQRRKAREAERAAAAAEAMAEADLVETPLVTAEELAAIRKAAYDEGYEEGLALGKADGLKRGEAEVRQNVSRWKALIDSLAEPLKEQEEGVEQALLRLAVGLASQLVRREIRQHPGQIIAVIREAMSYLPFNRQTVRLFMHPDDAVLVRETFAMDGGDERRWQVIEDPTIDRGGCKLATEHSQLDATLETRMAALVAEFMGGGRDDDA